MQQTISVLAENRPGVLMRVLNVVSARGWNIETVQATPTADSRVSRILIGLDVEPEAVPRLVAQMNKAVQVLSAQDLSEVMVAAAGAQR